MFRRPRSSHRRLSAPSATAAPSALAAPSGASARPVALSGESGRACLSGVWLVVVGLTLAGSALAVDLSLLPPSLSFSGVPGEYRESRMSTRSTLNWQPGLSWSTTTGLTGTRYGQGLPMRSDTVDLSTGPRIRLGGAELEVPLLAGQEMNNLYGHSSWAGSEPRLSVALGPNDRIRLEARLSSRSGAAPSRTRRSTALSWRHAFTERWAIRAGLRQSRDTEAGGDEGMQMESFASLNASLANGWRLSLQGTMGDSESWNSSTPLRRGEHSASWTLIGKRQLNQRWWVSGTLSTSQVLRGDYLVPVLTQSGGIRLEREF